MCQVFYDIDCSAEIPSGAKFAVLTVCMASKNADIRFRPKGSSESNIPYYNNQHFGVIVPLDSNRVFQAAVDIASWVNWCCLIGYIAEGLAFITAKSAPHTLAYTWEDFDRSSDPDIPANATGVIIDGVDTGNGNSYMGLRMKGSSGGYDRQYIFNGFNAVGLDSNKTYQSYASALTQQRLIYGYFVSAGSGGGFSGISRARVVNAGGISGISRSRLINAGGV